MRFNLTRSSRTISLRLVTIALVVCVAIPLSLHLAVTPLSAHSLGHSTVNATLNADGEPPSGTLPDDFIVKCDNTPEAGAAVQQFDPILFNGSTAPHYHLFFGNEGVMQTSTDPGLEQSSTTCKDSEDTAAEWVPALYYRHDAQLPTTNDLWTQCQSTSLSPCPVNVQDKHVYARNYYFVSVPTTDPKGYADQQYEPDSLQMVAGFPANTAPPSYSEAKYQVLWSCGASSSVTTIMSLWPYNCNANPHYSQDDLDGLVAHVMFPDCWDGRGLATPDQPVGGPGKGPGGLPIFLSPTIPVPPGLPTTFDLAYENLTTGECPTGFPYHIPRLSFRTHVLITNPCPEYPDNQTQNCMPGTSGTPPKIQLMVSTMGPDGTPVPGPWWTFHGDYWNTWQQGQLTPPTQPLTHGNGTFDDNVAYCLGSYRSYTQNVPCHFITDGHYPPLNG